MKLFLATMTGRLRLNEGGTYVKFREAGATLSAQPNGFLVVPDDLAASTFKHADRLASSRIEDRYDEAWASSARRAENYLIVVSHFFVRAPIPIDTIHRAYSTLYGGPTPRRADHKSQERPIT